MTTSPSRQHRRWRRALPLATCALVPALALLPSGGAVAAPPSAPVRAMEDLDRAPVAVTTDGGNYLGWRMLGLDHPSIGFHVWRDGVRITKGPIHNSTNFVDAEGAPSSVYRISAIVRGKDQGFVTDEFTAWQTNHLDIPLNKPAGGVTPDGVAYTYSANDASVGDVDGDGQYEVILKWDPSNAKDNSQAGFTGNVYIDAYELDGSQLWRVDLGRNIRAGAHYTQMVVYDLDSNGRAELVVKTADGTTDGTGAVIGDAAADHRAANGYVLTGPEFLTVFEGATGRAVDTIDYVPPRGSVASWGDNYGNRVDRFLAGVGYFDGERPSAFFTRGYYTRTVIASFDFDGANLSQRWVFDSNAYGPEYRGQGNHNLSVGDVDGDRRDEIVFGSLTIDDTGKPLYNLAGLGHGDAMHLADFDPDRSGLEVFSAHENVRTNGGLGATYRAAESGEILWSIPNTKDTGRAAMADVDPTRVGAEGWAVSTMKNVDGTQVASKIPPANFVVWWDGDLLREIADHEYNSAISAGVPTVSKWDWEAQATKLIFRADGTLTSNTTKGNPALQADLLGDWREELLYRTADSTALRLYTTTAPTRTRLWTLMHDPVYRLGVVWQNVAYNQPPHTSYYLGEGMERPKAPSIRYV